MLEAIIENTLKFLTPTVLFTSLVLNVLLFSGRLHKFRFNFHHLEHLKLKLEIQKLKRELGVPSDSESNEFVKKENEEDKEPSVGDKALFKITFRSIQFVKYFMWFVGIQG